MNDIYYARLNFYVGLVLGFLLGVALMWVML